MDSNGSSSKDLDAILLDDSAASLGLVDTDINTLISDANLFDSSIGSETFSETNMNELIHPILTYMNNESNPTEPNLYMHTRKTDGDDDDDEQLKLGKSNNDLLPFIRSSIEKSSQSSSVLSKSLVLSSLELKPLILIYPLEKIYRARYKSDYFPQNGIVRRPRYIADNAANHFITLQIPEMYEHALNNLYIRVALITTFIEGCGRFYSPYKFQKNHLDLRVPDENPMLIKVETNRQDNFIMRLQLVLIKSKSDQLNFVQPLKPFTDDVVSTPNTMREENLLPKDLITKYQLDQSQIAFTLGTRHPDGSTQIFSNTTVLSSIITEASTSKKTNDAPTTSTTESSRDIRCPRCSHAVTPAELDSNLESQKPNTKTSRVRRRKSPNKNSKKKKRIA